MNSHRKKDNFSDDGLETSCEVHNDCNSVMVKPRSSSMGLYYMDELMFGERFSNVVYRAKIIPNFL